jgi:amino acid permease
MTRRNPLVPAAIVLGIVLLVVGVIYFVDSGSALPSFFPEHKAGSSHHHVKHGIAALVLGVGCLLFAWFQTGPATQRTA